MQLRAPEVAAWVQRLRGGTNLPDDAEHDPQESASRAGHAHTEAVRGVAVHGLGVPGAVVATRLVAAG